MKKLIILADIKEYLPQLDREEITTSRFAEILNEIANKRLGKYPLAVEECCADKKQDVFITHTTNPNDIYCAFLTESEAIKEAKESGTTHTKITLYK